MKDHRFRMDPGKDFPVHSLLSVPLRLKGRMMGLLNVFNKQSEESFTSEDQRLLSIIAVQSLNPHPCLLRIHRYGMWMGI